MKTILNFMADDHDRLDKIFQEFKNIKNTEKNKARNLFHEFKIGLQRHIVWEEEILFPLFENKTGMPDTGPTQAMRIEHKQIKDFLERIHNNLGKNTKTDDSEEGLIEVLTEHNNKEESILYPWIDNSVSEEEKEEAFTKMKNLPPEKYNKCCE